MAHRSRVPGRLQRGKLNIPRDRGEKSVVPSKEIDEVQNVAPPGARGKGRRGEAHDLIRKLKPGSLPTRGRPV